MIMPQIIMGKRKYNMANIGYQYNKKFYRQQKANNLSSAKTIVPIIINLVEEARKLDEISVIDLGCGTANWLSVFKEKRLPSDWCRWGGEKYKGSSDDTPRRFYPTRFERTILFR